VLDWHTDELREELIAELCFIFNKVLPNAHGFLLIAQLTKRPLGIGYFPEDMRRNLVGLREVVGPFVSLLLRKDSAEKE